MNSAEPVKPVVQLSREFVNGVAVTLLVSLVLATLGYLALQQQEASPQLPEGMQVEQAQPATPETEQTPTAPSPEIITGEATLTITLDVQDAETPWAFLLDSTPNPEIRVKKGDIVEIVLKNGGNTIHDFTLPEFGITQERTLVDVGATVSVTFVADKSGSFTYFCAQPGHRELGMEGKFVVED